MSHILDPTGSAISIFSLFYLPLIIIHLVALFYIASLLGNNNLKPRELGKAVYVQIMLAFGTMLIIGGAFPLLVSLFSFNRLPLAGYGALIILILGGIVMLITLSKRVCSKVDQESSALPRSMYHCTFYVLGAMLCILSVLSFLIGLLSQFDENAAYNPMGWWVMPLSILAIGAGILLFFRYATEGKFQSLCRK